MHYGQKYSRTCLKRALKKKTKIWFSRTIIAYNAGKKYCRMLQESRICSMLQESILQYFRPSFSYHLSFRSLFLSIFEWSLKTGFTVYGLLFLRTYVLIIKSNTPSEYIRVLSIQILFFSKISQGYICIISEFCRLLSVFYKLASLKEKI